MEVPLRDSGDTCVPEEESAATGQLVPVAAPKSMSGTVATSSGGAGAAPVMITLDQMTSALASATAAIQPQAKAALSSEDLE